MSASVVIVGAGQAGLQIALSLRDLGYDGEVVLIGDEPGLPYQRPPLSKSFLLGHVDEDGLSFRGQTVLDERRITLLASERVVGIERDRRVVRLGAGRELPYGHLVLATGARNRALPVPGHDLDGVLSLRSLAEARVLKARLAAATRVAVVGAGFIGLEFAAVAAGQGLPVHVLEASPRVMARAVSPETSAFALARHAARGVSFSLDAAVTAITGEAGRATGVLTRDGTAVPADLVLVGIGVKANDELAAASGLPVADGVVVDGHLATADCHVSAIGDCAAHPNPFGAGLVPGDGLVPGHGLVRLESVQNAVDQARTVAARIVGRPEPYRAVPWFWSDQGPDKLQIAGLTAGSDLRIVKDGEGADRSLVFCFRGSRFAGLETVNRPADHMAARKVLASAVLPSPAETAEPGFTLKAFLARTVG